MNHINAQMEGAINFEPDFIRLRTKVLSSEINTVISAKGFATNSGRERWTRWKKIKQAFAIWAVWEVGSSVAGRERWNHKRSYICIKDQPFILFYNSCFSHSVMRLTHIYIMRHMKSSCETSTSLWR